MVKRIPISGFTVKIDSVICKISGAKSYKNFVCRYIIHSYACSLETDENIFVNA